MTLKIKKKKKKENKEMSTGTFPPSITYMQAPKNHVHIKLYVISTKNYFTSTTYLQYLNYRFLSMDFELRFWI